MSKEGLGLIEVNELETIVRKLETGHIKLPTRVLSTSSNF